MTATLTAPFPYPGGKSTAAGIVWERLGQVQIYVEPFAGSAAVFLANPHRPFPVSETLGDLNGHVVNVWRAIREHPDQVALHASGMVSEADLTARHLWLVNQTESMVARLESDPFWCDPLAAGWWIWGLSAWIGGGWCTGKGPWQTDGTRIVSADPDGPGVRRKVPAVGNAGKGTHAVGMRDGAAGRKFVELAERLRHCRVLHSDWKETTLRAITSEKRSPVGVFLDPPYLPRSGMSTDGLYAAGVDTLDVYEWAATHGDDERFRIVVAGHDGDWVPPAGWTTERWTRPNGFGGSKSRGDRVECLWASPHCHQNLHLFTHGG